MTPTWLDSLGLGARVVVVDSGWDHRLRSLQPAGEQNFTPHPMTKDSGHGQLVAELIQDTAPLSLIYVAKAWSPRHTNWKPYEQALDWAIALKADVVNLSFACDELSDHAKKQIAHLDQEGAICVASYSGSRLPGAMPCVVAVGSRTGKLPAGVLRVDEACRTLSCGRLDASATPSYATATVSGAAACVKAWDSKVKRVGFLDLVAA